MRAKSVTARRRRSDLRLLTPRPRARRRRTFPAELASFPVPVYCGKLAEIYPGAGAMARLRQDTQ